MKSRLFLRYATIHFTAYLASLSFWFGRRRTNATAKGNTLVSALWGSLLLLSVPTAWSHEKELTLIHMGDIHGHTTPRPNLRSDGDGRLEGGLARMYTVIKQIREENKNTLLVNTGDTLQGSGEALYTQGQALVDVLDLFGIEAYAPGNWDFVYGPVRFKQLFVNAANPAARRWGGLSANVYDDVNGNGIVDAGETTVLPAMEIKQIGNVKVGLIGCSTNRGPQVVGNWVTKGLVFTDCFKEVPVHVAHLRAQNVDLIVLISEIEIGRNIQLVEKTPGAGVDVILNSDMHEETRVPIQLTNADGGTTLIVEEGQDGTMLGQLKLEIGNGRVDKWKWKAHRIHDGIKENKLIAAKVAAVRHPYVTAGFDPVGHPERYKNVFNGTTMKRPLDAVVGKTLVPLHRSNFSNEPLPAVVEGSSHNWIVDALRWWSSSDIATLRGFRYGTHVRPGAITMGDLYHYVPIGPRVGKASGAATKATADQLKNQIENSSLGVFGSNPNRDWNGGWLFAYSNMSFDFNPYATTSRGTNIRINGILFYDAAGNWVGPDLPPNAQFSVAGYWYAQSPNAINNCTNCLPEGPEKYIKPVNMDANGYPALDSNGKPLDSGEPIDVTEVLALYLERVGPANPTLNRITLTKPLPPYLFGFPELQPLRGTIGLPAP